MWEGVEFVAWMLKRQELGAETGCDWPVRGSVFKTRTNNIKLLHFTLKINTTINKPTNLERLHYLYFSYLNSG